MDLVFAAEMQQIDRFTIADFGLPGRVLMENAGRGATRWFLEQFPEALTRRIGIVAGRGNNGGDGLVMARYLHQQGARVMVLLLAEKERLAGDAAANLELVEKLRIPVVCITDEAAWRGQQSLLAHQQLWIDAILGTGLKAAVRDFYRMVIDFLNASPQPVFAVDIPSGLDADTGQPHGLCVRAAATATFGLAKPGQFLYPGADYTGALKVIDIGIPPFIVKNAGSRKWLFTRSLAAQCCRPRARDAHKGDNGHLLVVAGAAGTTGAAALTSMAGLRAGAGLVTLAVPGGLNSVLEPLLVEAMTLPVGKPDSQVFDDSSLDAVLQSLSGKSCLALGPGLGTGAAARKLVQTVITESPVPVVLDADGLNCLAEDREVLGKAAVPLIITPHPGEMARLNGATTAAVQADRIGCAREMAEKYGVYTVLKGAATVIAHPGGSVYVNASGNPGMATGGMGDVLTGLIAGLVCQGYPAAVAARLGVYLHGAAADAVARSIGGRGFLASEVMAAVPRAITELIHDGCDGKATGSAPDADTLGG